MKQNNAKYSKFLILLIVVVVAIYFIESDILNIKHSLEKEFSKKKEELHELNSKIQRLLPDDEDDVRSYPRSGGTKVVGNQYAPEDIAPEYVALESSATEPVAPKTSRTTPEETLAVEKTAPTTQKLVKQETKKVAEEKKEAQTVKKQEQNVAHLDENIKDKQEKKVEEEEEDDEYKETWMNYDVTLNDFLKSSKPPNPGFIFHNKFPKCGSSTMNNVIKVMSQNQGFNYRKVEPIECDIEDDQNLIKLLKKEKEEPYLLLKHHFFFDFTKYGLEQPTYINVIRDPLEWFTSRYYFARYGWARKPGCRSMNMPDGMMCGMTEEEFNMSIDECVAKRHPQCTDSPYFFFPFVCGKDYHCFNKTDEGARQFAFEQSKKHVMNNYYVVGILEQFEETLMLLEKLLPDYYKDAVKSWKGDVVQERQEMTKTQHKKEMNAASRKFFLEGPLKYEKMFYDFTRKVFNERLKYWNIQLPPESD